MDKTTESASTSAKTEKEGVQIKGKDIVYLNAPEVRLSKDTPLLTDAQDLAGAINELFSYGEGGGEDYVKPWKRPSDWPVLPAPNDNQVIFLVTTALNPSPYCSVGTRPLDQYAFPENNGSYPEDLTINIDGGDGNTSTGVYRTARTMKWTNSHARIGPNANNPVIETTAGNYYYEHTDDIYGGKSYWNSGGTKLDDGSMVFIVTITVSNPQNVVIESPANSYALEMHIGRNININKNQINISQKLLQHVKAFGWQPGNNKDKQYSLYNSNTGTIYWNTNGIFSYNNNLRKIDATEPFTEIPDRMCSYIYGTVEIDLSEVIKIGDGAFQCTASPASTLELPKCTEIGAEAFKQFSGLVSLNAPALTTVGNKAFLYGYGIREISAQNLETISAEAFNDCYTLVRADVPSLKIIVTRGFNNCYALKDINAPSLEAVGDYAFGYCYSLDQLIAPNLSSAGSNAFIYCLSLKKLVYAKGIDLSKAGLDSSYLWYDNPELKDRHPTNIT